MLLRQARTKIETDKADDALAALLHAVRLTQGEDAIMSVLVNAKKQADLEAEERCQVDELELGRCMSAHLTADENALLWKRGEENILKDAFEDGSSVGTWKYKLPLYVHSCLVALSLSQ